MVVMSEQLGGQGAKPALKQSVMEDIGESVDSSAIMLIIYGIMVISIIAIPFLYFAIYSAFIRFLLAFTALLILMLFLSARTAERIAVGHGGEKEEEKQEMRRTGLASMKETVERAFNDYQSSQIIIRDTLRDVLVRRIAVKNRMEVWEVEEICTKGRAASLVSDPALQKLLEQRHVRPRGSASGILKRLRRKEADRDSTENYRRWLEEMMKKIDEV